MKARITPRSFDSSFYRRFYLTPASQVVSRADAERRAALIALAVQELDVPVRRILDAGCGLGRFRRPLLKAFPNATYLGLELSPYLCRKYGWIRGSIADYRGRGQFDLVICNDVLQYLDDRSAARATENLARLCRGVLHLHAPTEQDFADRIDRDTTDFNVHLRTGAWYRRRLEPNFVHTGFGVHVRRGVAFVQWELEEK